MQCRRQLLTHLLPDPTVLELNDVIVDAADHHLDITVAATAPHAMDPCCGQPATRIHSRSIRTLADLPTVVASRARRTKRLATAQQRIGLALGGAAGTRLAADLAMPAGIDVLLTLVRQAPRPTPPTSPHIGIDDWTKRKAHSYGSIIVDLDTHQPITLLDDRAADHGADWLRAHPELCVVSRDRGQVSVEGVPRGAPQAVQVADRWHLIKNLGEVSRPT